MNKPEKKQVLEALKVIIDPDLGKDIVTLGFIKNLQIENGDIRFDLELTTPACPIKDRFVQQCKTELTKLEWVQNVDVTLTARKRKNAATQDAPGLKGVSRIIGVSSCKGGVGKSTVAVNLAYALAKNGAKVGLLDADIYGPSIPTLVSTPGVEGLRQENQLIAPIIHDSVKLMSFGYATPEGKAAIMRGPMVSGVITQLATTTNWGELDYLVVDMPPGTGDIQLTLTQQLKFDGAVIVTTPQKLSFVDVVKGIQMFDAVQVPTLAIVENMSYFICDKCDSRHRIFGAGALEKLTAQYGITNTFEIPLQPDVSSQCDAGTPTVLAAPDSELAGYYRAVADSVVREVQKIENSGENKPTVTYSRKDGIVLKRGDDIVKQVSPADLRRRCSCANCKDEFTGKPILKPESVKDDIEPVSIRPMGNYAVAIEWSDGHTSSIYPYDKI
ncbi:MAG: P-loop NTPase [Deltaproteobacteria bacterium]|nr:P-loop NTPase [Deltaproteobacteria bacterium]MBN2672977.1 P-loop NTPase [Deltaproteobacteria bacterium]